MSEIPEDLRGEALDLLRLIVPEIGDDGRAYIPADEIETIALALLANEREVIERCASLQPSTAENPNESDYQRGRFDGIIETMTGKNFQIGDEVQKINGYPFPGEIMTVFKNKKGDTRAVVECTAAGVEGCLHIFSPSQLMHRPKDAAR